jgi:hypothetical protein|tara:strand:- start:44 stop:163 length:120 start_codon:yes stop_codon:yes gene_type:complete
MNNQDIITLIKLFVLIVGVAVALILGVIDIRNDIKESRK